MMENKDELNNRKSKDISEEEAYRIAKRSSDLEMFILLLICTRFRQIGEEDPISPKQIDEDIQKIIKQAHKINVLQRAEINRLIERIVKDSYDASKYLFDYRKLPFIPLKENKPLMKILKSAKQNVVSDNLFRTQAFMLRDKKDPTKLIPTKLSETYRKKINDAAKNVVLGDASYNKFIEDTIKELTNSGMRYVWYEAESRRVHSQRVEAAVRRNILDNVRDINQKVQNELGNQYGADGKEITVHEYSAPDHEPIQGHQFTNEEYEKLQNNEPFKDIKGKSYQAVERRIGIWNCRHFAYSIIIGISKPNYTEKELEENKKRNNEGYVDKDGKRHTMYECTQEQRRLEREIVYAKEKQMMAKKANNVLLARLFQRKINRLLTEYKQFSKACGLSIKGERLYVKDYKAIRI